MTMNGWRTIDTAPKDRLILTRNGGYFPEWTEWRNDAWRKVGSDVVLVPTHWRSDGEQDRGSNGSEG